MIEIKQTFIVERDGQLDTDLSNLPPTGMEALVDNARTAVAGFVGNIGLQARMAVFDALHDTNYRQIRNELIEQQKRTEFEKRIGIVAVGK